MRYLYNWKYYCKKCKQEKTELLEYRWNIFKKNQKQIQSSLLSFFKLNTFRGFTDNGLK